MAASGENTLFMTAVGRALDSWTVLQLAVNHGFGGADSQEKAKWMAYAIDQWFHENKNLDQYEIEDFLAEVMNNEFDTLVDDGSLPEMAALISGLYKLCMQGKEAEVMERIGKLPRAGLQHCVQASSDEEAEGDDDLCMETGGASNSIGHQQQQIQAPAHSGEGAASPPTNHSENEGMETEENEEEEGWSVVRRGKRK